MPEYPIKTTEAATIQELTSSELRDDPQFLLCYLCETVCNQELELAKQVYSVSGLTHVAKAVEGVLTSFKTGLEEMTLNGGVEFGHKVSTHADGAFDTKPAVVTSKERWF